MQFLKKPVVALFMQERHSNMPVSLHDKQLRIIYKTEEFNIQLIDIEYIEASEWLCKIYTADMSYICAVRLGKLCHQLSEYGFFRCHKGYAVNIHQVKKATSTKILLTSDRMIPIGKAYKNIAMAFINAHPNLSKRII